MSTITAQSYFGECKLYKMNTETDLQKTKPKRGRRPKDKDASSGSGKYFHFSALCYFLLRNFPLFQSIYRYLEIRDKNLEEATSFAHPTVFFSNFKQFFSLFPKNWFI